MEEFEGLVKKEVLKYGHVTCKFAEVMDRNHISRNRLKDLTGRKYDVVDRYYQGKNVQRVDLDFLARVCCVLHCEISDLLEYVPEDSEEA